MKIAVDLDHTLSSPDFVGRASAYIARKGLPFRLIDPDSHKLRDCFDWSEEDAVRFLNEGGIATFTEAEAKEGAAETLGRWREEGHTVVIVTARRKEWFGNPDSLTRDWLEKRRIPYDELVTSCDEKGKYCAENGISVLVDDRVKNCVQAQNFGVYAVLAADRSNLAQAKEVSFAGSSWKLIREKVDQIVRMLECKRIYSLGRYAVGRSFADGFEIRKSPVDVRFGDCAFPTVPPVNGLEAAVERVEEKTSRFLLTAADRTLEEILAGKGYLIEKNCEMLSVGLDGAKREEDCIVTACNDRRRADILRLQGVNYPPTDLLFAVKKAEGKTVALCSFAIVENAIVLGDVFTDPAYRRHGYAAQVIRTALSFGKRSGAKEAVLAVETMNAPAKALYASLGFRREFYFWYRRKA